MHGAVVESGYFGVMLYRGLELFHNLSAHIMTLDV